MVEINGRVWATLILLGMILLAVGAFGVMDIVGIGIQASIGSMTVGIVLIIISSVFIQIEGHFLRAEDREYRRFDEIRNEARKVPNDLEEGYIIDFTADPDSAVSYGRYELPTERDDNIIVLEPY